MRKKGVVEVQFNWIFILIAGGLILFFFINLIAKQRTSSEMSANVDTLQYLDKILSGTNVEVGTTRNITINNLNIEITPFLVSLPETTVEGKSVKNKIIFAPDLIKGNKLVTHSLYWECPYKTTYFLYLTSNEVRYIVVNNFQETNPLQDELYNLLPDFTTKERISPTSLGTLKDNNNYEVKLIFFNQQPPSYIGELSSSKSKITAINIIPKDDSSIIDGYGEIEFYEWKNSFIPKGKSYYLKKESLLGAVLTDNIDYYNENMKRALGRLNVMTKVYYSNAEELKSYSSNDIDLVNNNCPNIYDLASLSTIIQKTNNQNIDELTFKDIYENSKKIELFNRDLQRASCPILY